MNVNDLDLRKTALFFFDLLNIYVHGRPEAKEKMRPVLANAVRLHQAGRKAGMLLVFAHANHRQDGKTNGQIITDTDMALKPWEDGKVDHGLPHAYAGSHEAAVVPELEVRPEDYLIPKFRWSAFHQTYLHLGLRTRGIDTLIVCGCATNVGVASTVFSARDLDYNVVLARDACSGTDPEVHNALMDHVFPRMARIRTTDQVLEMIERNRKN